MRVFNNQLFKSNHNWNFLTFLKKMVKKPIDVDVCIAHLKVCYQNSKKFYRLRSFFIHSGLSPHCVPKPSLLRLEQYVWLTCVPWLVHKLDNLFTNHDRPGTALEVMYYNYCSYALILWQHMYSYINTAPPAVSYRKKPFNLKIKIIMTNSLLVIFLLSFFSNW